MVYTLDDGINVTRIFKRWSSAIKMKRFLRFLASNLPSQEINKENVIYLLYRTHVYKNTHLHTETACIVK